MFIAGKHNIDLSTTMYYFTCIYSTTSPVNIINSYNIIIIAITNNPYVYVDLNCLQSCHVCSKKTPQCIILIAPHLEST